MLLVARRVRIVSVAVAVPNRPILAMDNHLDMIALRLISRTIDSLTLRVDDNARASCAFGPGRPPITMRHHMDIFLRHDVTPHQMWGTHVARPTTRSLRLDKTTVNSPRIYALRSVLRTRTPGVRNGLAVPVRKRSGER
jgi:hypothetical protein